MTSGAQSAPRSSSRSRLRTQRNANADADANANAVAERWVGTVRRECLDHLLIVGRRQLLRVLQPTSSTTTAHRPHRSLGLSAPESWECCDEADPSVAAQQLHRRDVLGGLIHEYERAA
jgi:putative transposase